MKNSIILLLWATLVNTVFGQTIVHLEPSIGLQRGYGRFSTSTPHLTRNALNTPVAALQVRVLLRPRWSLAGGFGSGGAGYGYQAYVPGYLLNGGSSFAAGQSSSRTVYHASVLGAWRVRAFARRTYRDTATHYVQALECWLVAGPQLDLLRQNEYSPFNGQWRTFTGGANAVRFRETDTYTGRTGASLQVGLQLRYRRLGKERAWLKLYSIWGLTDLRRIRLDYELNGNLFTTAMRVRSTAVGIAAGIPIKVYASRK